MFWGTGRFALIGYGVNGVEHIPEDNEVCGFPGPAEEDSEVVVRRSDGFISLI